MTCTSEATSTQGVSSSQRKPVGPTLSALWAIRDIPEGVLGGNAKTILYALTACMSASGTTEAATSVLARATDKSDSTVRREIDRMIALGIVTVLQEGRGMRTYVYRVNVDRLEALRSEEPVPDRVQKPVAKVATSIRYAVVARDRGMCRYCLSSEKITIDHVIPSSAGGDESVTNLVACCRSCNSKKGAKTPEQAGMVLLGVPS